MLCPLHGGSRVQADGTLETADGVRRRYRCFPVGGKRHSFSVALDPPGREEGGARAWSRPPNCDQHRDEPHTVIRFGRYASSTPRPRQRYRCTRQVLNDAGHAVLDERGRPTVLQHVFTPPLPRDHVHPAEGGCGECEELRGTHHGETAVARRHSWPTRIVARGLLELSLGSSYGDVGRWALRQAQAEADRFAALVDAGLTPAEAVAAVDAEVAAADATAEQDSPGPSGQAAWTSGRRPAGLRVRGQRSRRSRVEPAAAGGAASSVGALSPTPLEESAGPAEDVPAGAASNQGKGGAKNARTREANNAWHVAADWCEVFAPVVFEPLTTQLRADALAERGRLDALLGAGAPLDRPQVLLLDDIPVYGRNNADTGVARRDEGFFLLVAAEVLWGAAAPDPMTRQDRTTRLRLVRAMPKSNAPGWRLVLDELGYAPDFVVADAGTGIARAVKNHLDPGRTTFVPSLWHVARAVQVGLRATPGATVEGPTGRTLRPELAGHLVTLSRDGALRDVAAWTAWWDRLEDLCRELRLPLDKVRNRRRNYEADLAAAIPRLLAHPDVPVSTGGLETVMSRRVEPLLARRRTSFANIERTNRLFDLVVAREHGAFDDLGAVVRLLREDAEAAVGARTGSRGWTSPLRSVADPKPEDGRYSSLRDTLLILELAAARGLT